MAPLRWGLWLFRYLFHSDPCPIGTLATAGCSVLRSTADHREGMITEQIAQLDHLTAQRSILACQTCGGLLWHFDAMEWPNPGSSPVLIVGYVCAGCGTRIEMLVHAFEPPTDGDHDHAPAPDSRHAPQVGN